MGHLINFLLSFPTTIYSAWLFTTLWQWFVKPLNEALVPDITVPWALGLMLMVSWTRLGLMFQLIRRTKDEEENDVGEAVSRFVQEVVVISFLFGLAAVYHHFMY